MFRNKRNHRLTFNWLILSLCYAIIVGISILHSIYVSPLSWAMTGTLLITGVVFGIGVVFVKLILWHIEKKRKTQVLKGMRQKIAVAALASIVFVSLLTLNSRIVVALLLNEDAFYEVFQGSNPYRLKIEYDEKWLIGKTFEEIVEKYGEFDVHGSGSQKYIYDDCRVYILKYEEKKDKADSPTEYLYVYFDTGEDGILTGEDICISTERDD